MSADVEMLRESERGEVTRPPYFLTGCILIGAALFVSGAAGLINQVVWQRSLRVFLGGSETVCSMVVVLVFMAGLGVGSLYMGRRATRLRNPLVAVGLLEAALALVNLAISGILATDLSASVFAFQKVALSFGVPLLLLYALSSFVILIVPCFLMGATMPLAAEACQRNLGIRHSRLLGLLFFINTLGSVLGTLVASGHMIAHYGLSTSLVAAAVMNLVAGLLLVLLASFSTATPPADQVDEAEESADVDFKRGLVLAFGLGFCSLGYEMYLLRIIPLRHEPLPFTFAAVLAGFLLFWSVGAALSASERKLSLSIGLRCCALAAMVTPVFLLWDKLAVVSDTGSLALFVAARLPYFIPCLFFGYLFGLVVREAARSWGRDVGRFYAWNTAGSCLGILVMTLIGYEMPFFLMVLLIALLLYALQEFAEGVGRRWLVPLTAAGVLTAGALTFDLSHLLRGMRMYSGRDGVIAIMDDGAMFWDGLWHSSLSHSGEPGAQRTHVGSRNWYLAVCPVFVHSKADIEDVCVIGVGTGITASTLARLETVKQVDGYDICRTLEHVFADYPEETLELTTNPKINLIWQDARTGLELNPKKYDIIQTQPLYLKQAGSALLNSVEFYRLIRDRLKPGGIFCLYSNGTPEQAFVVRQTADRVFRHRKSFFNGYLLVLSQEPIDLDVERLRKLLRSDDPLWREIRAWQETASAEAIRDLLDPPLPVGAGQLLVTDDLPIVEYPHYLESEVGAGVELPQPGLRSP